MTEIKRYQPAWSESIKSIVHGISDQGTFVLYKDHDAIVAAKDARIAKLQEQVRALAADNSIQDFIISAVKDLVRESEGVAGWHLNGDIASWDEALPELNHSETPDTDAALREVRAQARAEGIHFAANRLLAAWESGFVDDTPAAAHDISGAILSAVEFLPNADEAEFRRDYADEVRARIRAGEKS